MKHLKTSVLPAFKIFLIFTVVCGVIYTAAITGFAQIVFPDKANGSIIEVDGKKYGSELLGQQFIDDTHMWGRIMIIDGETFTNKDGEKTMYGLASNSSPASEDYEKVIAERVAIIEAANPEQKGKQIPVDLVTVSGSGLDPHISLAAAEYQIPRLVRTTGKSEAEIRKIIDKYTDHGFLGYFGETTVNVLKVNLALDGILK